MAEKIESLQTNSDEAYRQSVWVATSIAIAEDLSDFTSEQIVEALKILDEHYFNDDELVPDLQYDAIKRHLELTDPNNDYLRQVGSEVRGEAVDLPHQMGSLNQLYTEDDLQKFISKHHLQNEKIVLTNKKDGYSGAILYNNNGDLRIGYSRGDGVQGADITRHLRRLINLPQHVDFPNLEVRGEVIISKANFKKLQAMGIKSRSTGKPYKNPRNMVSGLMNSSEIDARCIPYIDVIIYHIWNDTSVETKHDELVMLQDLGFKVPQYKLGLAKEVLTEKFLIPFLNKQRDNSQYEIDGLVGEVDNKHRREEINPSKKTLNPEYSFKYKVASADNVAYPIVKEIKWNRSKHNYAKPTVWFDPVELVGVTVTKATGFNAQFIVDSGIAPGARIKITRSGDVIPFIIGVETPNFSYQHELDWQEIGEYTWTESGVDVVFVGESEEAEIGKAIDFFTKLDVDGLREGNIRRLFETGFNSVAKIINANQDEINFAVGSDSIGNKIYTSLCKSLSATTLPMLMGASSLLGRGLGVRKMQKIYDAIGDNMLTCTVEAICIIDSFDTKTATKFIDNRPQFVEFYDQIKGKVTIVKPKVIEGGKLNGETIIFTGFRNKQLEQKLVDAGAKLAASFSKSVTIVIAADPDENSTKLQRARAQGTRVIGLGEVEDLL